MQIFWHWFERWSEAICIFIWAAEGNFLHFQKVIRTFWNHLSSCWLSCFMYEKSLNIINIAISQPSSGALVTVDFCIQIQILCHLSALVATVYLVIFLEWKLKWQCYSIKRCRIFTFKRAEMDAIKVIKHPIKLSSSHTCFSNHICGFYNWTALDMNFLDEDAILVHQSHLKWCREAVILVIRH